MNASPLHDLQRQFHGAVTLTSDEDVAHGHALIEGDQTLDAAERLSVYSNAYFSRIEECLATDFQTVQKILSPEIFAELATDYVRALPPKSPNMNEIGRRLPKFIKEHAFGSEVEYLAETTELEWLVHATHYASLAPEFDFSTLATFSEEDWQSARFELTPSLKILRCSWPVDELWRARHKSDFSEVESEIQPRPTQLLIYRNPRDVFVERVSPSQLHTLNLMAQGQTMTQISKALESMHVNAADMMPWFSAWAQNRIVTKVQIF